MNEQTSAHNDTQIPECAFITAAGIGSRLRPYTDNLPKPLVPVQGRPVLDYILDAFEQIGIRRIIMNKHYKAEAITEYVQKQSDRPFEIITLHEDTLLDTGGGIKTGLPYFDNKPFFAVSGDSFWSDGQTKALKRMADHWDSNKMDLLLMLQPTGEMKGHAVGDYTFDNDDNYGPICRSKDRTGTHMWSSVRICTPALFEDTPDDEAFSFLHIMDKAENDGRLYGLEHDGRWFHISTPDDLERLNNEQSLITDHKIRA